MNVERLHSLALAVREDLEQTNLPGTLKRLRDALQNQVNSPQEPSHEQNVSKTRGMLETALHSAGSNSFPPVWKKLLQDLKVDELLGNRVLETVREVFSRNQITPSVALTEITTIQQRSEKLQGTVSALIEALQHLNVPPEEIDAGKAELGILIPRSAVDNDLRELGKELNRLDNIFGPFSELASGSRPGFPVRSIASSELNFFVDLPPKTAACIAVAVERIIALYKQLLEIRKLRREMSQQGVPDERLASIDEHAADHMRKGARVVRVVEKRRASPSSVSTLRDHPCRSARHVFPSIHPAELDGSAS